MKFVRIATTVFCLIALAALLVNCVNMVPPVGGGDNGGARPGQMVFSGPTEERVARGDFVPGSGIQYIGPVEGKGAELRIDGQLAYKKVADSVEWRGSPLPGVKIEISQRLLFQNEEAMRLGGTVRITIDNVSPEPLPTRPAGPIEYTFPVTYNVKVGKQVPGSTLLLKQIDSETKTVEFSGWAIDQYPLRKAADSVQWDGRLGPRVAVSQALRVAWIGSDEVQLAGLATVVLAP